MMFKGIVATLICAGFSYYGFPYIGLPIAAFIIFTGK